MANDKKVNWTSEQNEAITTRGKSLIVSAAAGSGKTAVLVERLVEILSDEENRVSIDTIVVVTFTNDAAEEIKKRLRDSLHEKSRSPWIKEQISNLQKANISTINAFCFKLLRDYMYDGIVGNDFSIISGVRLETIQNDILSDVINNWYNTHKEDMLYLRNHICSNNSDSNIDKIILQLDRFLSSLTFKEKWLDSAKKFYNSDFKNSDLNTSFKNEIQKSFDLAESKINQLIEINYEIGVEGKSNLSNTIDKFDDIYINYRHSLLNYIEPEKFKRVTCSKTGLNKSDNEDYKVFKEITSNLNDIFKKIYSSLLFNLSIEPDFYIQKKVVNILFSIYDDYINEMNKIKKEKNFLSFSDGEDQCIKLLCNIDENGNISRTDICKELSNHISLIMVDEYQDSNNKQDIIFRLLSKNCEIVGSNVNYGTNAFIVGDAKQSIYGFRNSNPENFIDVINYAKEADNSKIKNIYLKNNFRSSSGVINSVNDVFSKIMDGNDKNNVKYDDNESLHQGNTNYIEIDRQNYKSSVLFFNEDDGTSEYEIVAKQIKKMVDEGYKICEKNGDIRPCAYSDFVILLRSGTHMKDYSDALKKIHIPVIGKATSGLFNSPELVILINILKVINNPTNDIALSSVLMSPIASFSADDMLQVKAIDKNSKDNLYKFLQKIYNREFQVSDELYNKTTEFIDIIRELREFSVYNDLNNLLQKIYDLTNFNEISGYYEDSSQKKANIRLMLNYANEYTDYSGASASLSGFLSYIDNVKKLSSNGYTQSKIEQARLNSDDNSVRIMTIHGSKGLEFGFVFLADICPRTGLIYKDKWNDIMFSEDGKIGLKLYDKEKFSWHYSYIHNIIAKEKEQIYYSEEKRLLYVAMTRARNKLFIMIKQNKKGEIVGGQKSYANWIYNALNKNDFESISSKFTEEKAVQESSNIPLPNEDLLNRITQNANFKYKYADLNKESRITVSSIKDYENKKEEHNNEKSDIDYFDYAQNLPRANFYSQETGFTASERGTNIHNFLYFVNFNNLKNDLNFEKKRIMDSGLMTNEMLESFPDNYIYKFSDSKIFSRIIKCDPENIHKEMPFLVKINDIIPYTKNYFLEYKNTDSMLKGVVDLWFQENDGNIVILDYKTDNLINEADFIDRYSSQLRLYQAALQCICNKKIDDLFIYSFKLSKTIRIPTI